MAIQRSNLILLSVSCYFVFFGHSLSLPDKILKGQQLRDTGEELLSANGIFKLKFFSLGLSTKRYLGVWYNIKSAYDDRPLWIANRNSPIPDRSAILLIDDFGTLKITYRWPHANTSYKGGKRVSFSILSYAPTAINSVSATLLDSGNFVLRELNSDKSTKRVLWQSFDHPTDTLLPGMKLGINFKTNHAWSLTSWASNDNPASGSFTLGVDPNRTGKLTIWWQNKVYWTSGFWDDGHFEFVPRSSYYDMFSYTWNDNDMYFTYSLKVNYTSLRYMLSSSGAMVGGSGVAFFGGACSSSSSLDAGCVRKLPGCRDGVVKIMENKRGFMSGDGFKFNQSYNLSPNDCYTKCWENCSCVAYASTNENETGCEIWSRQVTFSETSYNQSRLISFLHSQRKDATKWWIWIIIAPLGVLVILMFGFFLRRKLRVEGKIEREQEILLSELGGSSFRSRKSGKTNKQRNHELQFFSIESILSATDNFANTNKLGEGGFGPVYKGELHGGQEIAIKRLSKNSGQGLVEFKNELGLIAKLQHTNLVRLVGCCIEREEKILIYEYMPNKSLDFFIFDPDRKNLLDWKKRFDIIQGVAQGLIYLHKYSRFRIIHRDLKVSNILLDEEMNPKISDFGLARIFGRNESEAKTKRIVGTYGYMSPEYAMKGIFSTKSDVFSFGVLILEIVSGRKNNSFYDDDHPLNLIGNAWEFWREGRALELMDPTFGDSYHNDEVLRCIHVGLLCVQDSPADRPTMSDVVPMISNEAIQLSAPKQPAYFVGSSLQNAEIAEHRSENCSLNKVTITEMEAR